MMSSTLGASLGGTMRGAHHGLESVAFSLITPPNFGSGGGSCSPLMVVVALGWPMTPVVWISARTDGATVLIKATEAVSPVRPYLIRLLRFMIFVQVGFPKFGRLNESFSCRALGRSQQQ